MTKNQKSYEIQKKLKNDEIQKKNWIFLKKQKYTKKNPTVTATLTNGVGA